MAKLSEVPEPEIVKIDPGAREGQQKKKEKAEDIVCDFCRHGKLLNMKSAIVDNTDISQLK